MKVLRRWKRKIKRFLLAPVRAVERHNRKVYGLKVCAAKRSFQFKDQAWRFALNCNKIKGGHLSAYQCRYCGKFHLTSKFKDQVAPKGIKL